VSPGRDADRGPGVRVDEAGRHILSELGFTVKRVGEDLHGTASVFPELHVPGTRHLRTSVLAIWADHLAGLLAAQVTTPRVPVTLKLSIHLYRPAPESGGIVAVANTVKQGRTVFVARVHFADAGATPLGVALVTFMSSPDPSVSMPPAFNIEGRSSSARLAIPLAQRAGCARGEPGTAILPRTEDGLNSSNTVNGGLIALVTEESVLSLSPGTSLCSLDLNYLHATRVGPAVAQSSVLDGLGETSVSDAGNGNRVSVIAFSRTFA
jgi:acyl-coenzyme A thioesterase PaaI-like protein